MPADLLAGVVILLVVIFLGLKTLEHHGRGLRKVHLKITVVPPSLDLTIEERSD